MNLYAFIFDFLLDFHHLIFLSLGLLAGTKIGRKLEQRKALRARVALSAPPTLINFNSARNSASRSRSRPEGPSPRS